MFKKRESEIVQNESLAFIRVNEGQWKMKGLTEILRKRFIANVCSHHSSKKNYVSIVKRTVNAVEFGKPVVKMSSWGYLSHNGKSFLNPEN